MELPLQISLRGIRHSDALQQSIREKAARLERFYAHIMSCRVVVELDARHKRHGRQYSAHIDLKVPRGEIAVTHAHHEDLDIALREAFDAARRKLEEPAQAAKGKSRPDTMHRD